MQSWKRWSAAWVALGGLCLGGGCGPGMSDEELAEDLPAPVECDQSSPNADGNSPLPPASGAVALPASAHLFAPFPAGRRIRVRSGYSPGGGSSLHAGTNRTCCANDYYALDLAYDDAPNAGLGEPVLAPLAGVVVKAGWATSGWANYGQRVILRHDLGDGHVYDSLYAHLNAIDPAIVEGAAVSVGQRLGALGRSCMGALSCSSFSNPHLHFSLHRDASVGGSGTGGSYAGHAVVPEPFDGANRLAVGRTLLSTNGSDPCSIEPPPPVDTACRGKVNGLWCDGADLLRCAGGDVATRSACTFGCLSRPPGVPDECAPDPATLFCTDKVNGLWCDGAQLVRCTSHAVASRTACSNGCQVMPPGVNDRCR